MAEKGKRILGLKDLAHIQGEINLRRAAEILGFSATQRQRYTHLGKKDPISRRIVLTKKDILEMQKAEEKFQQELANRAEEKKKRRLSNS